RCVRGDGALRAVGDVDVRAVGVLLAAPRRQARAPGAWLRRRIRTSRMATRHRRAADLHRRDPRRTRLAARRARPVPGDRDPLRGDEPGGLDQVPERVQLNAMPEAIDWRIALPPGFRWPDGVRAAACFTFDVD